MKNSIIVPFDLNTARKIKSGEIEGSVLINNIEIEFVYESKNCAGPYNLLFVKKDESGISAIYADTEGRTFFNNDLELEVEAGAYFKKGDILISTLGNPFIYNGIINIAPWRKQTRICTTTLNGIILLKRANWNRKTRMTLMYIRYMKQECIIFIQIDFKKI